MTTPEPEPTDPTTRGIVRASPEETVSTTTLRVPGLLLLEHELMVPLDHDAPDGPRISVFAREVADPDGADKPILVFLQGGPGVEAPRPARHPLSPGWLDRALADYRVLLLDQRGTGRSTPVGDLPGRSPQQQADHLAHFRADSIVRDAELFRQALGVERWSVLGQSFGGFCVLSYLSMAPDSLVCAYVTGGLPPIGVHPDEVYASTWARMRTLSNRYYARYPADRQRVRDLHEQVGREDIRLPAGERLTSTWLRYAGHGLGMSDGEADTHALLELPATSPAFRHDVSSVLGFARNPLYALVHEACYADGATTAWSAQRTRPADVEDDVTLFYGEHLDPAVLTDVAALAPLAAAADLLADRPWPRLYDPEVLAATTVPVAALVYADDPYVDATFSLATADTIGARVWLTNEYLHNGLRADGTRILERLFAMAADRV